MRYYLIKEDKKYQHAPQIVNWYRKLDIRHIKSGCYDRVPNRILFYIRENPHTMFIETLFSPFFLVSKEIKKCLALYEPNLDYKEFILLDKKNRMTQEYFLPALGQLQCLTTSSIFNLDHSKVRNIEIDLDAVEDKSIFLLSEVSTPHIIIRLDVAESMLRRGARGFLLEEVDCIKGGKLCQTMKSVSI